MVLSPMLNAYSDSMNTRRLGLWCLAFFTMEILFDWLLPSLTIFGSGYTPFAFVGLYLLGRYMARSDSVDFRMSISIFAFFVVCLLGGCTMAVAALYGNTMPMLRNKLMNCSSGYTTPLTLMASFLIVMVFKHLNFRSRFVNWLAASAFAVYLFHGGLPFFKRMSIELFSRYNGLVYFGLVSLLVVGSYLAGTIIDQLRRWAWLMLKHALTHRTLCK